MAQLLTAPAIPLSWPTDTGFAKGRITLGEIEARHVSALEKIWSFTGSSNKKGAALYKPVDIPPGYFILGHHCEGNTELLQGWVVVVKDINENKEGSSSLPPLEKPVDYSLVWSSKSGKGKKGENGFFWRPIAPQGYKALGYLVTKVADKPSLEELRCVRSDLTGVCKTDSGIWSQKKDGDSIQVWNAMPDPEKQENGVFAGTFYCTTSTKNESSEFPVACLLNMNSPLTGMPSLDEVHSIIGKYGPSLFCHPKETYFPSSVSWFFRNGALLYKKDSSTPEAIAEDGSNLPQGGSADGEYWIDLPKDSAKAKMVRRGDLESAEAYVHVKSVLGGTFTDVVMWVFYPFNGPGTLLLLKALSIPLPKIGEHVGDWEHVTLRINNFAGELWGIYLSQHSGGRWVKAGDLEYVEGSKKAVVYSSKNGHACFPRAGVVVQGSQKLGVGIANYSKKSTYFVDTSTKYKIVAAEYLKGMGSNEKITEPAWLNYARKWGPKIKYAASGLLGSINLPSELSGQDGPTGPKWKSSWYGDEKVKDVF
ncbi:hypothetical protein SUGI_1031390 [Cryptomeria japonica]|uniref:hypothetical protein At1g04090 n=1 Tax=Cryptomeria japonica TaxID=3369 RepID=UPI002414CBA4|nr:hypothetical protein At1g04090 [Cryptomeria japonica]GLJ48898.1 hypothetical protein SUGI_1031390 [Cryptomeria japonica]